MIAGRTHSKAKQAEDQAGRKIHGLHFNHFAFAVMKTYLKAPKCPSTEESIKKIWSIYIMECYSGIKKEIMPFVAT